MNNEKIVDITLELTLRTDADENDIANIVETMLRGAAQCVSQRDVTGTGFNYSYTRKRSKRGLSCKAKTTAKR